MVQRCTTTMPPSAYVRASSYTLTVGFCHYLVNPANGGVGAATAVVSGSVVLLFPSFNYPHSFWEPAELSPLPSCLSVAAARSLSRSISFLPSLPSLPPSIHCTCTLLRPKMSDCPTLHFSQLEVSSGPAASVRPSSQVAD